MRKMTPLERAQQRERAIGLTAASVRCLLAYDKHAGTFRWRDDAPHQYAGQAAGCLRNDGYLCISIHKTGQHTAHRLAWLYVYGEWPAGQIDHKNGVRTDNRIENLRIATVLQNAWNQSRQQNSTSGLKGAHWNAKAGRWQSAIKVLGKSKHLGLFDTAIEAHNAYVSAAVSIFGEFARA